MRVRHATPIDAKAIRALLRELGYRVSESHILSTLGSGETRTLIAEDEDGATVGLISFQTRHVLHLERHFVIVDSLVVSSRNRSKGIGEALVSAVLEDAEKLGANRLALSSNMDRLAARRFYERLGFVIDSYYFIKSI